MSPISMNTRWTSASLSEAKGLPQSFDGRGEEARDLTFFTPLPSHLENARRTRGGLTAQVKRKLCFSWAGWTRLETPHDLRDKNPKVASRLATRPFFMGVERGRRRFLLSPGIQQRRVLIRSLMYERAARGALSDALPLAPSDRRDASQSVRAPRRAGRSPRSRRP